MNLGEFVFVPFVLDRGPFFLVNIVINCDTFCVFVAFEIGCRPPLLNEHCLRKVTETKCILSFVLGALDLAVSVLFFQLKIIQQH